ncbi:MAG: hypothetical protein HQM04_08245 [Magnetococcales bacterium]|nr:hypothetical protein [Magnetococcales bacterium]MBF0115021.1 hypothetical protein [Magnetococcales bacterium]
MSDFFAKGTGFFLKLLAPFEAIAVEEPPLVSACSEALCDPRLRTGTPDHYDYVIVANRGIIASMVIQEAHKAGKRVFVLWEQEDLPYFDHLLDNDGDIVLPVLTYKDIRNKGPGREDIQVIRRLREMIESMNIPPERVAIHPGYGFNSEDPEWNAAAGQYFKILAPSAAWIELLGNKMEANRFCQETAIPLPISSGDLKTREDARAFFRRYQTTVQRFLFKDCFGGGGKGQLEVDAGVSEEEFLTLFEQFAARHPAFIVNEFVVSNRHIEMQVMIDKEGSIRFGPMRDCTLQRGKQKIIEEVAIGITAQQVQFLRDNITAFFQKGAEKLGHPYEGLATFEMMYLPLEKRFYFLEVNTRIQVEHPVSGHQGGIQFIQTQFDLAEGKRLKSQAELDAQAQARGGHTMEARICFERFLSASEREAFKKTMGVDIVTVPESGQPIHVLELPAGRDVTVYMDHRLDGGDDHQTGRMPNKQYDSMVIQIVARGVDRDGARRRLISAVETLQVRGLQTNQAFVLALLRHPLFVRGESTSDQPLVQEAMAQTVQFSERAFQRREQMARRNKQEQQTRQLLQAIANRELALPEGLTQLDLPYLFATRLGHLKPTTGCIRQLLTAMALSAEELRASEERVVIHWPLGLLVHDLLDTFGAFGVHLETHHSSRPQARFSVPCRIQPLFLGFLQQYADDRAA